jgi:hypothetical protein
LYCKYFRNINYNRATTLKEGGMHINNNRGITNGKCINPKEREFYCRPRRIRQFEDRGKMVQPILSLEVGLHRPGCTLFLVVHLLTYLLTPWSRVLLEKPTSKLCS